MLDLTKRLKDGAEIRGMHDVITKRAVGTKLTGPWRMTIGGTCRRRGVTLLMRGTVRRTMMMTIVTMILLVIDRKE